MPGRSRLLQVLAFVFLSLWRLTSVFGEWARLSIVLVSLYYDTYRAHDQRMKSSVSAERAYWTADRQSILDERGNLG